MHQPFYDPDKSYEENYNQGPFGAFTDGQVFVDEGEPQQEFLGQAVYLPFGIAAGPLLNTRFVRAALQKGFDLAAYKTVRTRAVPAHQWPNVLPVNTEKKLSLQQAQEGVTVAQKYDPRIGITNSFGVPSAEKEVWQKDLASAVKSARKGQVVIGSFQGTHRDGISTEEYIADYAEAAALTAATGVKVIEANFSCPNENTHRLLCFDAPMVKKTVISIRERVPKLPLIVKIAYFADQNELEQFVREVGPLVSAISAINTIPARVKDETGKPALPGEGREFSGICGAPIHLAGLEMVQRLKELRARLGLSFVIIGVGGVVDPTGYQEFRDAGADAVMCATGAMWNQFLAQEIKRQVISHM
jgi:dihydroorotate dehydrogenase